jgi:hypothetical protein
MPFRATSGSDSTIFRANDRGPGSWFVYRAIGLIVLVNLCGPASLSARTDETDALIDRVLQSSGVAGQVETLSQAVLAAVPDDAFPGPKVKKWARSMMKKAAGLDSLLPLMSDALKADFRVDLAEQVILFYGSPLGKEVGRITKKSCTAEALAAIRRNREMVVDISEPRLQAIQRILEAQRVVEFNSRLLGEVIKGLAEVSSARGTAPDFQSPEIRNKLESVETDIRSDEEKAWMLGLVACAHTFRSLKDKELEELARFYESDAGGWFVSGVQEGLEAAIRTAARALAEVLSGMNLQGKRNESGR